MRLADARRKAGCDPAALDRIAGVSPGTTEGIERGRLAAVPGVLTTLAHALCMSADALDEYRAATAPRPTCTPP